MTPKSVPRNQYSDQTYLKLYYIIISMFGKKNNKDERHHDTEITDKKALKEIKKIADQLDDDEAVLEVANQGRLNPGAATLTTPKPSLQQIED